MPELGIDDSGQRKWVIGSGPYKAYWGRGRLRIAHSHHSDAIYLYDEDAKELLSILLSIFPEEGRGNPHA